MEQQHYFGRAHDHLLIWVFLRTALRQTFHWKQKPIHQSKEFLQRNIYSLASLTWGQFQNPILFKVTLTLLKPPTRTQTFSNPSPFLLLHLNARVQEDSCKPNAIQAKKRSEVEANPHLSYENNCSSRKLTASICWNNLLKTNQPQTVDYSEVLLKCKVFFFNFWKLDFYYLRWPIPQQWFIIRSIYFDSP